MKFKPLLIAIYLLPFWSFAQPATEDISKKLLLEDMDYLYNSLIETNYDLFAYVEKSKFDSNFELVKSTIRKDSYSSIEATALLQSVISAANIGHTNIDFPSELYRNYAYSGGTLFPLELLFNDNKALIKKNFSQSTEPRIGDEILSINGESIDSILSQITPLISAENHYFKLAKIEAASFPRLYWQVFGKVDQFKLKIRQGDQEREFNIPAIDLIDDFEMKRNELLHSEMKIEFNKNIAYLNPGSFSGDEQKFKAFIDRAFLAINEKNISSLILDFRNNAGGDNHFSDYLVSFIAEKPFQWTSGFWLKTSQPLKNHTRLNNDLEKDYFKQILAKKNGEVYQYEFKDYIPQKEGGRYKGKVYVLINRHSHSQSTVTAAQLKDLGYATLVGETTGEYPSLYASQFKYQLPNTQISVNSSKGYIVRLNGDKTAKGLAPDIFIKSQLKSKKDSVLVKLLEIINDGE